MTGIIVQARLGSERLPKKILKKLAGRTVLDWVLSRCKDAQVGPVICTTPDEKVANYAAKLGYGSYRHTGPRDCLKEFVNCIWTYSLDTVVRITADCPCVDPDIIRQVLRLHVFSKSEYTYNRCDFSEYSWPDGTDVEVIDAAALLQVDKIAGGEQREHVTKAFHDNEGAFKVICLSEPDDPFEAKLSLDTKKDYRFLKKLFKKLPPDFRMKDIKEALS